MTYKAADHYWIVAGDATRVYSSARAAYATLPDALYTAWLATGRVATRIASEADLWDVLAQQAPAGLPAGMLTTRLRTAAQGALDNNREFSLKVDRAILMAFNDAINQANTRFNSLRTEILAATSLANLQTRVGTIAALPTRTDAQALQQVKDRITAGTNVD